MMSEKQPKTKQELDELKKEVEELSGKLKELTDEELEQVSGGVEAPVYVPFAEKSRESALLK